MLQGWCSMEKPCLPTHSSSGCIYGKARICQCYNTVQQEAPGNPNEGGAVVSPSRRGVSSKGCRVHSNLCNGKTSSSQAML